jgi:phage-related protein
MDKDKEIRWVGSSYDDLVGFPDEPRRDAGFQLSKVQAGLEPEDWKPFDDVGTGTKEIRIRDSCTASKRKRRPPVSKTRTLPKRVIAPWSTLERSKNDN